MSYYKIYSIFFCSISTLTSFTLDNEADVLKYLTKLNAQCKPLLQTIEIKSNFIYFDCQTEQEEMECYQQISMLEAEITWLKFLCWRKTHLNLNTFEAGETDPKQFLQKIKDQSELD
jgi:hypothetical protein